MGCRQNIVIYLPMTSEETNADVQGFLDRDLECESSEGNMVKFASAHSLNLG